MSPLQVQEPLQSPPANTLQNEYCPLNIYWYHIGEDLLTIRRVGGWLMGQVMMSALEGIWLEGVVVLSFLSPKALHRPCAIPARGSFRVGDFCEFDYAHNCDGPGWSKPPGLRAAAGCRNLESAGTFNCLCAFDVLRWSMGTQTHRLCFLWTCRCG